MSLLFQPALILVIIRINAQNFFIKSRRMVHLLAVTELVHDDAVEGSLRREHQEAIEAEISACIATAP